MEAIYLIGPTSACASLDYEWIVVDFGEFYEQNIRTIIVQLGDTTDDETEYADYYF